MKTTTRKVPANFGMGVPSDYEEPMKPDLSKVSASELEAELKRRRDEEEAARKLAFQRRLEALAVYLDTEAGVGLLKLLLPEHQRNTCTGDEDLVNVERCTRCTVLRALQDEDFEVISRINLSFLTF